MSETEREDQLLYRVALRRTLMRGEPDQVTLHFEIAVLDRYRGAKGLSIIRTDTVGRVRKEGGWSLDFGIAPDETMIHVTYGQLINGLKVSGVGLDRKSLADLAVNHPAVFASLAKKAQAAQPARA